MEEEEIPAAPLAFYSPSESHKMLKSSRPPAPPQLRKKKRKEKKMKPRRERERERNKFQKK